jgi:hypothetical protein
MGGLFEAPEYWNKRGEIGQKMQEELDSEL